MNGRRKLYEALVALIAGFETAVALIAENPTITEGSKLAIRPASLSQHDRISADDSKDTEGKGGVIITIPQDQFEIPLNALTGDVKHIVEIKSVASDLLVACDLADAIAFNGVDPNDPLVTPEDLSGLSAYPSYGAGPMVDENGIKQIALMENEEFPAEMGEGTDEVLWFVQSTYEITRRISTP